MPVEPESRPLLDDRRTGGSEGLLGRSSLTIDRAASDETFVYIFARTASKPWGGRCSDVPIDASPQRVNPDGAAPRGRFAGR